MLHQSGGADRVWVWGGHSLSCWSLIGETAVAARAPGWNSALGDLALFAGASPGTARVKPGRKRPLLVGCPCSSPTLTASSQPLQEAPGDTCRNRAQAGGGWCVCVGVNHNQQARGASSPSFGPKRKCWAEEDRELPHHTPRPPSTPSRPALAAPRTYQEWLGEALESGHMGFAPDLSLPASPWAIASLSEPHFPHL